MTSRQLILTPLILGLTAVWMIGISQAAPQRGKKKPTLAVAVFPSTIAEEQTATGTVSRVNADLTSAVVVTLSSSDTTEATVNANVTIPINASSATFDVTGVNDGTGDGVKTVTITAAASGFESGSANVMAASPALPPVRYRVQFVPISEHIGNVHYQDVNASYESVGWFTQSTNEGNKTINRGFYYNAATREYLSATEMLPSLTGGTQFVGINNFGWIVGSLVDPSGLRSGILIYPDLESDSGWSYDTVPGPANAYEYYPRDVNNYGDIAGVYWRLNSDGTQGSADAFAYNPGLLPETISLEATPLELAEAHLYSIQVSNQRRALAVEVSDGEGWWFDFGTELIEPVAMPASYYINVTGLVNSVLSNDGQLAVAQEFVSAKKHRGSYTYTYTPGVVQDGTLLWEGDFDGRTFVVNSAAPGNQVGDALGFLNGEVNTQWMQHANWGYLDIYSMLLFDPPVGNEISDQELWTLGTGRAAWMSDRDSTGFGMIVGYIDGSEFHELFVLIPEEIVEP